MANSSTLVKPPPLDPSKSAIENVLELTELASIGADLYTNTRPLWHPPGARGIYGGSVIAQCLAAAQLTVSQNFTIHSMHCYFVLAGDSSLPIIYHVEHVREGKSYATRTVQARQRGRPIFTTTMSFVRENSGGKRTITHEAQMPEGLLATKPGDGWGDMVDEDALGGAGKEGEPSKDTSEAEEEWSPFVAKRLGIFSTEKEGEEDFSKRKTRQWMRARGRISPKGGHGAHLSALAYMSDSYFIGTISRIHGLMRLQKEDPKKKEERDEMGMMVSLDHTIYFHSPRGFRADEWIFTECESDWAGDGRGLVAQKMWGSDGRLVATCFQEGVVRLKLTPAEKEEMKREQELKAKL